MDIVFGALLALVAICAILAGVSIRTAKEAARQAASAHDLAIRLEGRDTIEILEDDRVRIQGVRRDHVRVLILRPDPEKKPQVVTPGNLFTKEGTVKVDMPATKQDLDDLFRRIRALAGGGPKEAA